jgi:hypothetical protein
MNAAQLEQARVIAEERMAAGEPLGTLVHILHYPLDHELAEDGIMGLSTGLPPDTDSILQDASSTYYTLIELAELTDR